MNMRNWVSSMNRLNEKDHAPLVKAMESITGTSYKGRNKGVVPKEPIGNTIGDLMEISEDGINLVN